MTIQVKQDPVDPVQRKALADLADANGFKWKKELTLELVDVNSDDPCKVLWTISNAGFGSFTCDEYPKIEGWGSWGMWCGDWDLVRFQLWHCLSTALC